MRPEIIVAIAVPLFLAVFAGFWCLVVLLISQMSGWQTLARNFPATYKPQGQFFGMESIIMNTARYKGAVTIGATDSGLYLAPLAIFGIGHPPLLIPWNALRAFRSEKQAWMVLHTVDVVIEGESPVRIAFYNTQVAMAIQAWATQNPLAR